MAKRLEGVRVVVEAMFKVFPALSNVLLVGLLFYFIFAVLALNLVMGEMYACQDVSDCYCLPGCE